MTPPTTCPLCGSKMEPTFSARACAPCRLTAPLDVVERVRTLREHLRDALETQSGLHATIAELDARIAELQAGLGSITDVPGLRAKLDQDDLHALLRWRSTYARQRVAAVRAELQTPRAVLEGAVSALRERGAPLVCPASDCVHIAKGGVWVTAATLTSALDKLDAKLETLRGGGHDGR